MTTQNETHPVPEYSGYTVQLTYFREGGKFYSTGEYVSHKEHIYHIWDEIKAMETLPDLIGSWNGPILVSVPGHPHDHPRLIMPKVDW